MNKTELRQKLMDKGWRENHLNEPSTDELLNDICNILNSKNHGNKN